MCAAASTSLSQPLGISSFRSQAERRKCSPGPPSLPAAQGVPVCLQVTHLPPLTGHLRLSLPLTSGCQWAPPLVHSSGCRYCHHPAVPGGCSRLWCVCLPEPSITLSPPPYLPGTHNPVSVSDWPMLEHTLFLPVLVPLTPVLLFTAE